MISPERRKVVLFTLLMVVFSMVLVYRDIVFVHDRRILLLVELVRTALILTMAKAALIYRKSKLDPPFPAYAKICFIVVMVLDIAVTFTRPRDDIVGVSISILLLIMGYFVPMEDRRFKIMALMVYNAGLIAVILFFKSNDISAKAMIVLLIAGIDAVGAILSKPAKLQPPFDPASRHESPPQSVMDYRQQIMTKIQTLPLSEREKEVAYHILLGESRSEIAEKMSVSDETIKKHAANIYDKLHVSSRSEFFKAVIKE